MTIRATSSVALFVVAVVVTSALVRLAAEPQITGSRAWLLSGESQGGNQISRSGCSGEPKLLRPCALEKARAFNPPRTPDGKPNIQGFWDRTNAEGHHTAAFVLEEHPAMPPEDQILAGKTLIVDPPDGKIPYRPEWVAKHQHIIDTYVDQQAICLPVGVPRHFLGPGFYRIVQSPGYVTFISEHAGHVRIVPTDGRPHIGPKPKLWLGDSVGRWEGNTLVIDTTNQNGQSMVSLTAKDFTSSDVHVVERYTLFDLDAILLEVTITDPKVFTRPWTMSWGKTRSRGKGLQLIEEACYEGNRSSVIAVPRLRFLGIDGL